MVSTSLSVRSIPTTAWKTRAGRYRDGLVIRYVNLVLLLSINDVNLVLLLRMLIWSSYYVCLVHLQNSIRHNLSLNQYFMKAPREKEGLGFGKGGYWCMHPDYEEKLTSQAYVKRKKKGIPVFPSAGLMSTRYAPVCYPAGCCVTFPIIAGVHPHPLPTMLWPSAES